MGTLKYNQILKNEDLIPEEYYWCISKKIPNARLQLLGCSLTPNGNKMIGSRIWAMDENNQALEKYDIYGPIPKPDLGDIDNG